MPPSPAHVKVVLCSAITKEITWINSPTSCKQPLKMSSLGGRLQELRPYWVKIFTQYIWKLQRLSPCFKCFIHAKSQFQEKIWNFIRNFKLLALKVVAVAYERWSLKRGSK